LGNAEKHKKRVMGLVTSNSNVSIFLIGDKQSEYAYHHTNHRVKKNVQEIMTIPEIIEFFSDNRSYTIVLQPIMHQKFYVR